MATIVKVLPRNISFPRPGEQGPGVLIECEVTVENAAQQENFLMTIEVPVFPTGKISEIVKWTTDYLREKGWAPNLPL